MIKANKNSIKLTIVAKQKGAHQNNLKDTAEKKGLKVSIISVDSLDLSTKAVNSKIGDAVIWRRSKLDIKSERPSLKSLLKNKIVVSDSVFESSSIYFKYYQQQVLKQCAATSKWSIPTYRFGTKADLITAINNGLLAYPIIAKPNAGSRGDGIKLVKKATDIKTITGLKDYVFQNFIPNDGDWRIIVVGGTPIGVLLRRSEKDQFINNISKGATGSSETNPEILSTLRKISTKVASLFHSNFCGVDIIRNSDTGEYMVLELNTAPQWLGTNGFESITGVSVTDAVIDWIIERNDIKNEDISTSIELYYKNRINQIPSEAFHFASRLWLWTGDNWARQMLDDLKQNYIGLTPHEIDERIKNMVKNDETKIRGVNQKKAYRKDAFEKYKKLPLYNALLFKTVFCDSVYNLDLRPYIKKYITDREFIDLFHDLIDDGDAIRLLSTHAVNYFYLLKNYFKDKLSLSSLVLLSADELMKLLPGYKKLENAGVIDKGTSIKLQIYLLTHAIIGQSRFYSRCIKTSQYKLFCKKIEKIIEDNYYDISLDNKLEFLVCCQICGYETSIRKIIEQESEKSVSWAGNFLVDNYNSTGNSLTGHCLRSSEHRNVLYLMSQKQFVQTESAATLRIKSKLPIIGRLARIKMQNYGVRRAIARIDSGATNSSIDTSNVYVKDDVLYFTLFHEGHPMYTGKELTSSVFQNINMRNSTSEQERYAVMLKFELGGQTYDLSFALADRSSMLYPILLGRNFLTGRYTVDTSRQFIEKVIKKVEKK